ncbi:hypothetical protein K3152_02765 [Qipengyuania sp. 1NDH17]|uniref:Uncharacterized protein n=1 Tax=Qipengyuania polymorpha TaxID=2867234 RepID=A0ABS7IUR0_9SPHN|nr:hypothetical protein [Qipengyuania polymorpha]MBX7457158.1 hypothetical protein [Qipengyuania polymorpha]
MPYLNKLAAAPAMLAALSLTATPASAADMAIASPAKSGIAQVLDVEASQTAEHHRYHRYRYRRGPGLGDVLAGVLIVGAIAHVAKSASEDRRYRDRRDRDRDYRRDVRWNDERGLDRAVGMCIDAVERRARVETVDRANRTARGWSVEGTLSRGGDFDCEIDNDGRGVEVNLGRGGARYERDGRDYDERYEDIYYDRRDRDRDYEDEQDDDQWDDDRYSSEWSKVDRGEVAAETAQAPTASYPGGPVDGDDDEIDDDLEIGTGYPGAGA